VGRARHSRLLTVLRGGGASWYTQAANEGTIDAGGVLPTTLWSDDNSAAAGLAALAPRTFMNISGEYAIRQTGTIKRIDFRWRRYLQQEAVQHIKFHTMRPLGGGVYRVIDSTPWIDQTGVEATNTTAQYTGLSLDARVGDFLAITIVGTTGNRFQLWATTVADTAGSVYKNTDPSGDVGSWTTFSANLNFMFHAYIDPPKIVTTGDSIIRGSYSWDNHNTADGYDVVTYDLTNDPAYLVANQLGGIDYQNHGKGSTGWDAIDGTTGDQAIACLPLVVVVSTGINDILSLGSTWNDVLGWMNAFKTSVDGLSAPVHIAVAEILPCTDADDTEAGTIRTWNASYAAWCATNGATLLRCHDALGKVRVSTGELDDIIDAYDHGDGIHLSAAGLAALAEAVAPDLKAIKL
jgi:lysophospholipase L1-like esterase